MIITINVPPAQIDALTLLAGGESEFLRSITLSAAQGVARKLQDHLREYDASHPNKMGWPRQHFVKGLSDDIQLDDQAVTADGAQITASPEFFHRLEGGDVRPVSRKNLAIPARAEAYAAGSPGEGRTPPLTLLLSNKGGTIHAIALALVDGAPEKAFAHRGLDAQIWYYLTAGPVHHDGNPDMMPEESDLREAALAGAEEVLAMQLGETMERVI
jgi:hypothetical protein